MKVSTILDQIDSGHMALLEYVDSENLAGATQS